MYASEEASMSAKKVVSYKEKAIILHVNVTYKNLDSDNGGFVVRGTGSEGALPG